MELAYLVPSLIDGNNIVSMLAGAQMEEAEWARFFMHGCRSAATSSCAVLKYPAANLCEASPIRLQHPMETHISTCDVSLSGLHTA